MKPDHTDFLNIKPGHVLLVLYTAPITAQLLACNS